MEQRNTIVQQSLGKHPPYHYLMDDIYGLDLLADCEWGDPHLDLHGSDGLIGGVQQLLQEGWAKQTLLTPGEMEELRASITRHVLHNLQLHQPVDEPFVLEKYHTYLAHDSIHYAISSWALPPEAIGPLFGILREKIEQLLGVPLAMKEIDHRGQKGYFLGFRMVRPGKADHNPYHRDAWLPYWRNTVNVWLPVAGFHSGNTINLLPKTHRLEDSQILKTKKGAIINGNTYHVPAAIGIKTAMPNVRPELSAGEGLVFSPYLLHGNGINQLPDQTRVSIELRFCGLG